MPPSCLKLLNNSLIHKLCLQLAQPCIMRLLSMGSQSIGITPFLNQEQVVTAINRCVIVVFDVPVLSTAGNINALVKVPGTNVVNLRIAAC